MTEWNKLLFDLNNIDARNALRFWTWAIDRPVTPLLMTKFGDWFLKDKEGSVHRLSVLDASFERVALTEKEFHQLREEDDQLIEWFWDGLAYSLYESGVTPTATQAFGFKVAPVLGGAFKQENIYLVEMMGYQLWLGQLHQQLSQLEPGTAIDSIDVDDMGRVHLVTRPVTEEDEVEDEGDGN